MIRAGDEPARNVHFRYGNMQRNVTDLLELIELAKVDNLVAAFSVTITDEELCLLWQHELETIAYPRLEQARARLAKAKADHDLGEIERSEWSVEFAEKYIQRCLKYGGLER